MSKASVLAAFKSPKTKKAKPTFTHNELVLRACQWLRSQGCKVVMAEPGMLYHQSPDALGFETAKISHQVECKVSRSDFLADGDKQHKKFTDEHQLGQFRWYMTPRGLLKPEELPEGWGLLEVTDCKVFVVRKAARKKHDSNTEMTMMFTALAKAQEEKFHEAYVSPEAFTATKVWATEARQEDFELYPADDVTHLAALTEDFKGLRTTYLGRVAGSSAVNVYNSVNIHRGMISRAMNEEELLQIIGTLDAITRFTNQRLRDLRKREDAGKDS